MKKKQKQNFKSLVFNNEVFISNGNECFLGLKVNWPLYDILPNDLLPEGRIDGIAGINIKLPFKPWAFCSSMGLRGMVKIDSFDRFTKSQLEEFEEEGF